MNKDEIEARALELYPERKRQNKKGTGEYDANLPRRKAYIKGWTDAQPTLPEDSPGHHRLHRAPVRGAVTTDMNF